jgi:hypothetical protein
MRNNRIKALAVFIAAAAAICPAEGTAAPIEYRVKPARREMQNPVYHRRAHKYNKPHRHYVRFQTRRHARTATIYHHRHYRPRYEVERGMTAEEALFFLPRLLLRLVP